MRYAVIDFLDSVVYESSSFSSCVAYIRNFGQDNFIGIFDYVFNRYITDDEYIDYLGVTLFCDY